MRFALLAFCVASYVHGCVLERSALGGAGSGKHDASTPARADAAPVDAARVDAELFDASSADAGPGVDAGPFLDGGAEVDDGSVDAPTDVEVDGGDLEMCPGPFLSVDFAGAQPLRDDVGNFDLETEGAARVEEGAAILEGGSLDFRQPNRNRPFGSRLEDAEAFSVEVWLEATDVLFPGDAVPYRIVTFSEGANRRTFTLGRDGAALVFRMRSDETDENGIFFTETSLPAELVLEGVFPSSSPLHVVVTWNAERAEQSLWARRQGEAEASARRVASFHPPDAELEVSRSDRFRLGDENGSDRRRFSGRILHLAVFDEALNEEERGCLHVRGPARAD